jgi:hypothetical protein
MKAPSVMQQSLIFVVYVPLREQGRLYVYGVLLDDKADILKLYLIARISCEPPCYPNASLQFVDLEVMLVEEAKGNGEMNIACEQQWRLWALWMNEGRTCITYSDQLLTFDRESKVTVKQADASTQWTEVASPPPDRTTELLRLSKKPGRTFPQGFVEYAFHPLRYSTANLTRALHKYLKVVSSERTNELGDQSMDDIGDGESQAAEVDLLSMASGESHVEVKTVQDLSPSELSQRISRSRVDIRDLVVKLVGRHVSRKLGTNTYEKRLSYEWIRFLSICDRLEQAASAPLSMVIPVKNTVIVTKRERISVLRLCEDLEVLRRESPLHQWVYDDVDSMRRAPLSNAFPKLSVDWVRVAIISLFRVADILTRAIDPDDMAIIEHDLVKLLARARGESAVQLAKQFFTECLRLWVDDALEAAIWNAVSHNEQRWRKATRHVLEACNEFPTDLQKNGSLQPTHFMYALQTSALTQIIESRYMVARDLLLVLIVIVAKRLPSEIGSIKKTMDTAMVTFQMHATLKWITEQYMPSPIRRGMETVISDDGIIEKLDNLSFVPTDIPPQQYTTLANTKFLRYSLLRRMIHWEYTGCFPHDVRDLTVTLTVAARQVFTKGRFFERYAYGVTQEGFVRIADLLEMRGYPDLLQTYLGYVIENPAIAYIRGKFHLKRREYDQASRAFQLGAESYRK